MTKKNIKKILIIRFSSIGDIVLTTPVVRCVKKQLSAEVHFLTKKPFKSLLSNNPHVDKIFTIEKKVAEVLPQLKLEKYDVVIDLHKNLRSQQVRWALRIPYYTFDKLNWEKWWMVNFKINKLPQKHIVERYMESVKSLGVKYDGEGLDYFLPPSVEIKNLNADKSTEPSPPLEGMRGLLPKAKKLSKKGWYFANENNMSENDHSKIPPPDPLQRGREFREMNQRGRGTGEMKMEGDWKYRAEDFPQNYLVFAIGGAHATKRLPIEKIIAICEGIHFPIFLLGGKADATIGEKVVLYLQTDEADKRVVNLCGKTTLEESAQIIQHARKVITHDTGMMHIAAAFQKEIISIWGNTIPEFGMHPFYKKGIQNNVSVEVKNLSCRPCSKIGFDQCPKGHFKCMMDIEVQQVIDLANELDTEVRSS